MLKNMQDTICKVDEEGKIQTCGIRNVDDKEMASKELPRHTHGDGHGTDIV